MTKKDFINSPNITETEILELKKLFPKFFSEWAFDLDWFREYLNWLTVNDKEFYRFEWTGKQESKMIANKPSKNTLLPDEANSKNWNETENIFIEWDNLEVLKLLQNKYFGQIKMIYIDPPYNKDKDFVYKDTWKDSLEDYLLQTWQVDEDGETTTEKETTGRKHSNWLNMIYPRLILARRLLREDGVIFVSIDDDEVHNLRKVMDEVFGEDNFIAQILVDWTPKNDPFFVATSHEYCLLYTKDLNESKNYKFWVKNPLFDDILRILEEWWNDFQSIEKALYQYYISNDLTWLNISNYKYVDEKWVYRIWPIDDPQWWWPKDSRLNPVTGKNCKTPNGGWRCNLGTWKNWIIDGLILFPNEDDVLPSKKIYITSDRIDVMQWYFKMQTRKDTDNLKRLFNLENTPFSNPKPLELIKKFVESINDKDAIILDFFAWSWTTAHAIMEINKDWWKRKFISVQIPEPLSLKWCRSNKEKKITKSAIDFLTSINKPLFISEITKERIRRDWEKLRSEWWENVDIWFRAFKLSESNFTYMSEKYEIDENTDMDQLELQMQREIEESWLRDERTQNDIIYELIIREWYSFNSKIETLENGIYKIIDINDNFFYFIAETKTDEELQKFIKANLGIIDKKNINLFALEEKLNESQRVTLSNYFKLVNL